MEILKVTEVFTPNDQPTVTYVIRDGRSLESDLRDHFETPNIVVSISGPSKTGKTVLLRNVLDMDFVIALSGSAIKSVNDFFEQVFNWIEIPIEESISSSGSGGLNITASGGGEVGIPLLVKGKVEGNAGYGTSWGSSDTQRKAAHPFQRIVKEIAKSDFTIFVDDFHYIPSEVQIELAKVIKGLSENGVRICTASVPHRAEDVVRANPELKGRLAGVDIAEWDDNDLRKIADQGFKALNCSIDEFTILELSKQAYGSPQLMQLLCLNIARNIGIKSTQEDFTAIKVSPESIKDALEVTATFANSSNLVQSLHGGPKVKGQPRMQYEFNDGTKGDVYRGILLALVADPIQKEFTYDDLYNRVKSVCLKDNPTGQSISQSLTYMNNIVEKMGERTS